MHLYSKLYFYYARNAINYLLDYLKLGENDVILTPAWDCCEVLEPFIKKKCMLIFYKTDPYTFKVDIEDLESKISKDTKLIHIINHFGHIQEWDTIYKVLQGRNIPILEDNAFSLHSKNNSKEIGSFGDFSIFSFRKVLPVSNGSVLIFNKITNLQKRNHPIVYFNEIKQVPFYILDLINFNLGFFFREIWYRLRNRDILKLNDNNYNNRNKNSSEIEINLNRYKASSLFCQHLVNYYSNMYIRKINNIKIKRYLYLSESLNNIKGVRIINPDIENIVPTLFSILIENRDCILIKLRNQGFPVRVWPTLSSKILLRIKDFPDVKLLSESILQIELFSFQRVDYELLVKEILEHSKNEQ